MTQPPVKAPDFSLLNESKKIKTLKYLSEPQKA